MPMMAITTSSSTSVKPTGRLRNFIERFPEGEVETLLAAANDHAETRYQ